MSGKLVVDIWHSPYGDASTILVLMALVDEANDKGEYTADISTISRKARQGVRNCRYILRRLERLEIIECLEARGRGHTNSYRVRIENLQNLQNLQILQPVPVKKSARPTPSVDVKPANTAPVAGFSSGDTKPAKPANTATSAGLEPSSTNSLDLSQDLRVNPKKDLRENPLPTGEGESMRGGETTTPVVPKKQAQPKRVKRYMPTDEEGQATIHASVFDANMARWHKNAHPHVDIEAQWTYFVNACLAKDYQYADFRAAFMNSFTWSNSPAQQPTHADRPHTASFVNKNQAREEAIMASVHRMTRGAPDAASQQAQLSLRPGQSRNVTPRPADRHLQGPVFRSGDPEGVDD